MPNKAPAKWPLPDVLSPPISRCYRVYIPDDIRYVAAFKGAMYELTKPYSWEAVRAFYSCGRDAASDEIYEAIGDGRIISAVGQEPPGGQLPIAECHTYHVLLRGADKWLCPVPVSAGWTVHVTPAIGGWGTGGVFWYCPDGKAYLLGVCQDGTQGYDAGGPLPTAYHGQVGGGFGSVPTYFDPLTAEYQIPAGNYEQPMWLQMNDSNLADNLGSVQLTVEVCNVDDYDLVAAGPGITTARIGINKWHVVVPINQVYGGIWQAEAQCWVVNPDEDIVCGRYTMTNTSGWTNVDGSTSNNGGVFWWPSGYTAFATPLPPGETWQSHFMDNGYDEIDTHNLHVRS